MDSCIFCKIVAKEIPAHIIYEDKDFLAFLDIHPRSPGHIQLIPKDHYRWVWDIPNTGAYFEVAQKLAKALQKAFGKEMIRSQIAGDEVAHAHLWLWPTNTSYPDKEPGEMDFEINMEKIKAAL